MWENKTLKKTVLALLILLLTLSILRVDYIVPVVEAEPDIYWVEAQAVGNGTSEATPAGNITYVLGMASSNDVIEVKPGIYNTTVGEIFPITINIANLTVQSIDGAANTIIDGGGSWGLGVHIQNNVTLQGFTIRNFKANATYGIGGVLIEGDGSTIRDNVVENIFNCTTEAAGIGIDVHAKDVQITNNTVHDLGSIGIRVRDHWKEEFLGPTGISNNVLVENNTVYRTNNTGVLVTGYAKGVTIRNNEIYESLEPTPYSLFVHYNSSDVIIENNYVHDSLYSNVVLAGCDNVTISGNNITGAPTWLSPGKNIYILNDYGSWTGDPTLLSTNINITNNNIKNGGYGVRIMNTTSIADPTPMVSTTTVNYNNIVGNSICGVENRITADMNAVYNWWGNATGPYHPTLNSGGTGDNVSDYVNFDPWLLQPFPPANISITPVLYVDPPVIECWTPSYGKNFTIEVKIDNVTDLFGYEFKLYWNTTLLNLIGVQITPPWGSYLIAKNETDEVLGRYWLAVGAYDVPPFDGNTTVAQFPFQITYDPIYPENKTCKLDLADTKLTAPLGVRIYHTVDDGNYHIYSTKPKIEVKPSVYTAHALHETVTVDINVSDVVNLYEFNLTLAYNTTLLDATSVVIGPFLNSPISTNSVINDTAGFVSIWACSQDPAAPANDSGTLVTITFEAIDATIWPEPQLTCSLDLHQTTLRTKTGAGVQHEAIDGTYIYAPKPGDLDMDGKVNLVDLRIVAYYYDPNYDIVADLNRDAVVDIFDLSIVASYYGEDP